MPIPVQSMASSLGILESRNIFSSIPSPPANSECKSMSITPINMEITDTISSEVPRIIVDKCFLMNCTSFLKKVSQN